MRRLMVQVLACGLFLILVRGVEGQVVELEAAYLVDGFRNVAGGERQGGAWLHNLDLMASVDGEALLGVSDLEMFVYLLGNAGGSVGDHAGDWQGASNIEAPTAVRVGEAWIQKAWDEDWSMLIGLYDLNSEFYVAETGLLFLNSSHGIGPEFGESGRNGPSIFPVTSLAARLRWQVTPSLHAMVGVFDGVPGDPERPEATRVHLDADEGALLSGEVAHREPADSGEPYRKLAVGGWAYTGEFDHVIERGEVRTGTFGVYILGEAELFREGGAEDQGLAGYGRIGYADEAVHAVSWGWGGALVYTGLLPGRERDQTGVGVAGATYSPSYLRSRRRAGEDRDPTELNLEWTYAVEAGTWLRVQPNVQYVVSPGMKPELENALLVGLRLHLSI